MKYNQPIADLGKLFVQFKQRVFELLPNIVGAIAIFLIGLLIARFLRNLTNRFFKNIGRLIPHKEIQSKLQPVQLERSAGIISNILYWIVIFFFITAATEVLGLPVVTAWLGGITNYLPKIFVAALIGVVGIIGGVVIRDIITTTATSAGITYSNTLGKFSQYAILLVTLLIGIDQIGIDITIITNVLMILISAIFFGAALAFGLGAGTSVSNILASHYAQKTYKVGHIVKISGLKGQIIEITPVAVILQTSDGQLYVPAKQFSEMTSVLISEDS